MRTIVRHSGIAIALAVAGSGAYAEMQNDSGRAIFSGPLEAIHEELPGGRTYSRHVQVGSAETDNESSPFFNASIRCAATAVHSAGGDMIYEYAICEATRADGDQVFWMIYMEPPIPSTGFKFIGGTGAFHGMQGSVTSSEQIKTWPDGTAEFAWEITWEINQTD